MKRPITPPATLGMLEYQSADHEYLMKRLRPAPSVEEVIAKGLLFLVFYSAFVILAFHCDSELLEEFR